MFKKIFLNFMHLQITKKIIHTQTNMTPLTTSIQLCISPDDNDHSKNPENYAKIEEKLSIVLAQLDGHLDGPDFRKYTKDFGSSEETYKIFKKNHGSLYTQM